MEKVVAIATSRPGYVEGVCRRKEAFLNANSLWEKGVYPLQQLVLCFYDFTDTSSNHD